MTKLVASALIFFCILFSVATAQTGEDESWQLECVKYEGDKWTHWHFQPSERRFQFSEHEWIQNAVGIWFRQLVKQRICKVCLRWEVLRWKSSPRSDLEPTIIGFEELVGRIEKKKARE